MNDLIRKYKYIVVDTSGSYLDEAFYYIEKLDRVVDKNVKFIVYNPKHKYNLLFTSREIINLIDVGYNISISMMGCLIEAIKNSEFTITMNFSEASHLSLLLNKKLFICKDFSFLTDYVKKINPLNTDIVFLKNYDFNYLTKEKFEL